METKAGGIAACRVQGAPLVSETAGVPGAPLGPLLDACRWYRRRLECWVRPWVHAAGIGAVRSRATRRLTGIRVWFPPRVAVTTL